MTDGRWHSRLRFVARVYGPRYGEQYERFVDKLLRACAPYDLHSVSADDFREIRSGYNVSTIPMEKASKSPNLEREVILSISKALNQLSCNPNSPRFSLC